jgi:hypothetical protein
VIVRGFPPRVLRGFQLRFSKIFAATQRWAQARNLFPEPGQPSVGYDEAALV